MKLFQQLLLAPAALGLLAPLAANAAEININDVANYANQPSSTTRAIKSVQFSDVVPGDWAYTALQNLSESYGCVDNAYTQNLKSGQALTRYEAAALINACLDSGIASADVDADTTRLAQEFGTEMAILKGRVQGLEYKVQELSAGQFSSTTKLSNKVAFVTGYVDYDNSANNANGEALAMNWSYRADLNSSFTGKDRLYTRLFTGNMGNPSDGSRNTPWGDKKYGTYLGVANNNASVTVDKLWYEFPVGDFKFWVGPKIENYYMLAASPSIYKPVLKQFALGGNGATYGSSTDGGFGVAWSQDKDSRSDARITVSTNYASKGASDGTKGLLTDHQAKWLNQITYGNNRWQVAGALAKHYCTKAGSCKVWTDYFSTDSGNDAAGLGETAYALRAYWKPEDTGTIVPSIQFGYDIREIDGTESGEVEKTDQWMAGFMWQDAFTDSDRIGVAIGKRQSAKAWNATGSDAAKDNFVWEAYYDYKVNDNVTVTPTIFGGSKVYDGTNDDIFGALVQTVFKF